MALDAPPEGDGALGLATVDPAALYATLVDLEHFARWTSRYRYGCALAGWSGRSAGASEDATRDQVRGLLFRLGMDAVGTANDEGVSWDGITSLTVALFRSDDADLCARILDLMAEGPRDAAGDEGPDPGWSRGRRVERLVLSLAARRETARAAATLAVMSARCPPTTTPDDVALTVAWELAATTTREKWQRAEILSAARGNGKAGRPRAERLLPPARLVAGLELVTEAVTVWRRAKETEHG